ncbi:MAG: hypothetical protein ACTHJ9_00585 [Rhodanobacter sp.]
MNSDLSKALPKVPEGLGWHIAVSGDMKEQSVTIRLKDLFDEKRHIAVTEYEVPKGTSATGVIGLVAQQARELLNAYERGLVLATLSGLYDGWDIDLEDERKAA